MRHQIRVANCGFKCMSQRTNNLIPDEMPIGVIYGFEVINIHH